ncbi:MAG: Immunoglobulin I-set domain protein, partial [Verrucomicrobia bacterium]|nr:Immunoglobulin I-set domain protein [Verrucomicrobiota bacterium]
ISGAGTVVVQAAQAGNGSFGAATTTQSFSVAPAVALVTLSNLTQAFDGSPKSVTATTIPSGLSTTVTYNGSATSPSAVGSYTVFAGISDPNYSGSATGTLSITGAPAIVPPAILQQPLSQLLGFGSSVMLSVSASGTAPLGYQWYRDGIAISGATSSTYAAASAATYTVVVTNSVGTITSAPAVVTLAARLANVSGRVRVGVGNDALILGLVVTGDGITPKKFLIRAAGPGLAQYGVSAPLAQPQLAIYSGANVIASNSGWGTAANPSALAAAAVTTGAFPFATNSADSALLADLLPGTYSVVVKSADASTGISLAEAYELNTAGGQLVNLSARLRTGLGEDAAIVGFVVAGTQPAKVLIRGAGPALAAYGVTGALAQPQLAVYANSTLLGSNQGWESGGNAAALSAAAATAGAFPFTTGSADCAMILTLPPGNYSAHVTGVNSTVGVALVEVYQLP